MNIQYPALAVVSNNELLKTVTLPEKLVMFKGRLDGKFNIDVMHEPR